MNIFAKISAVIGLGMFFLSSPAKSAPILFNIASNGNNLTITTSSSTVVNAGIKSVSAGFSFTNCTLDANGYCRFSVINNLSQSLIMAGPAIQPQLTICSFDANNNPKTCQNIILGDRFAYIVSYLGFSVSLCPINSSTGQLSSCTVVANGSNAFSSFPVGAPVSIALNPAGTLAYVTTTAYNGGQNNVAVICPINPDGSFNVSACTNSPQEFVQPWYMTLNANGSTAYVANGTSPNAALGGNNVSICSLNTLDGSFINNCSTFSDASFNRPAGIVLNKAGTLAYITNLHAVGNTGNIYTVSKCSVNITDGSLSSCVAMADPTFFGPSGITLNNKGTWAYVTNYAVTNGITVSFCPINANRGGIFKSCTALSDATFRGPIGIQLYTAQTTPTNKPAQPYAYITNYTTNQVSVCPINPDGSFGACTASDSSISLNNPTDIALF